MKPVVIGRILAFLFILVSLVVIVPWLRYRPLEDIPSEIALENPPPPRALSYALTGDGVVYSERKTIPQEPWVFGPLLIGSLGSFAFLTISLLIGKLPED